MMKTNNENIVDYSNPDNLNYYLIKGSNIRLNVDIIKQKYIETDLGTFELAIIGSSHYIKLENQFTELLSCTPENIDNDLLLAQRTNEFITVKHQFDNFQYTMATHTVKKETEQEFIEEERNIALKNNDLQYFFDNQTSLTALQFNKLQSSYLFVTWHSYPEHLKIVYSATVIYLL